MYDSNTIQNTIPLTTKSLYSKMVSPALMYTYYNIICIKKHPKCFILCIFGSLIRLVSTFMKNDIFIYIFKQFYSYFLLILSIISTYFKNTLHNIDIFIINVVSLYFHIFPFIIYCTKYGYYK